MGSRVVNCAAPWPHVEIEEFLPPDVAQRIAAHWPQDGFTWLRHSDIARADGTSLRRYWKLADVFPEAVFCLNRLEPAFRRLFDVTINLYPQMLLVEDSPGYFIRRHTDCAGKVISAQVYLPDDVEHESQGLVMCDRLGGKAKQIPYRFNHGYAFKVTDHSWHKVAKSETRRRSLQIIYYDTQTPRI